MGMLIHKKRKAARLKAAEVRQRDQVEETAPAPESPEETAPAPQEEAPAASEEAQEPVTEEAEAKPRKGKGK